MSDPRSVRLEAIRRELRQQDEAWERTRQALARLGDVQLAVPHDVLARIVGTESPTLPPTGGLRA